LKFFKLLVNVVLEVSGRYCLMTLDKLSEEYMLPVAKPCCPVKNYKNNQEDYCYLWIGPKGVFGNHLREASNVAILHCGYDVRHGVKLVSEHQVMTWFVMVSRKLS
jgi:hypothetical protein